MQNEYSHSVGQEYEQKTDDVIRLATLATESGLGAARRGGRTPILSEHDHDGGPSDSTQAGQTTP